MERIPHDFLQEQIQLVRTEIMNRQNDLTQEEALRLIEDSVLNSNADLSLSVYKETVQKIYAQTRSKLGMLEHYIEDDAISEIMVNSKEQVFLERANGMHRVSGVFDTEQELEEIIRNIAAGVHREINEMHPILDARLSDGSRVNAVYGNICANGPVLTIRKFAKDRITVEQLVQRKTMTPECAALLDVLVRCGYNIFVSGGTSSGKTTFLNALSDFIPSDERVIVIEDSRELQLEHIPNLVQMECHNANSMGQGQISMEMLIKTSLRMRPDRIIVGEVRGKEVANMIQAMNSGHDGSMSTGHGNSVSGMLRRLEAMYLMGTQIPMDAIRAQIVEGIDIMIHLGRLSDVTRRVLEVQELVDFSEGKYVLNPLFYLNNQLQLISTQNQLKHRSKLIMRGCEQYG